MRALKAFLLALLTLLGAGLACNFQPGGAPAEPSAVEPDMTLAQALQVEAEDARPEVLRLMGVPDAFTIEWQTLEGQPVRLEEWSYFDQETRFDFLDGELVWTIDIEPAPDGSLFSHFYDPLEFGDGMSLEAVRALLSDQVLDEIALDEAELPGGLLLVGDQILLGFDGGTLVSAQTLVLAPDESVLPPPTPQAPPPATASVTETSNSLLSDDFEATGLATALFGPEHMEFVYVAGEGALTSRFSGVLPAMYPGSVPADFVAQVDIRAPDSVTGSGYGLVFRSDDPVGGLAHYYHLLLWPADGQVSLDAWVDGAWVLTESAVLPPGVASTTGSNTLRLEAQGSEFRVTVNGTPVLTVEDNQIPGAGALGLSIVTSEGPETAYFDNLVVTAP